MAAPVEATSTTDLPTTAPASTTPAASDTTTSIVGEATTSTQPATTVTSVGAGAGLILLERAAWGARAVGDGFVAHTVSLITVHHTAVVLGTNSQAPARVRQHQNYHQGLGWPDIAYHVMIDRAGNLYEGRPVEYRGDTATSYDPTGHFLPCLEGDYNTQTPTEVQMEALARLCAWASDRWGVEPASIGGHRDYAATSCPGGRLYDHISSGSLERRVSEIMAGGAPSLSYLRGAEAASVIAAIEAEG